jgi:hypothetical protein
MLICLQRLMNMATDDFSDDQRLFVRGTWGRFANFEEEMNRSLRWAWEVWVKSSPALDKLIQFTDQTPEPLNQRSNLMFMLAMLSFRSIFTRSDLKQRWKSSLIQRRQIRFGTVTRVSSKGFGWSLSSWFGKKWHGVLSGRWKSWLARGKRFTIRSLVWRLDGKFEVWREIGGVFLEDFLLESFLSFFESFLGLIGSFLGILWR